MTASRQISLPGGLQPHCLHSGLCNTLATLETRVCHSRAYFNSHPTPLLFVLSFAHIILPVPFLPATTYALSTMSTQSPPVIRMSTNAPQQGLYLYSFILDRWHPRPVVCSRPVALVSFPFLLQHLRPCFPSFTILSNSRPLHSPILFFLIFLLPVARWCALCATYLSWIVNFLALCVLIIKC